jgi:hypothetical protein
MLLSSTGSIASLSGLRYRGYMKRLVGVLLLSIGSVLTACGGDCTLILLPGIRVTIVDGATGNPFAGDVTVTVTDGSYTETDSPPPLPAGPRVSNLAGERPGTYRVEVRAPGHVTWVKTNVRVRSGDCHVKTVDLTAELEPSGTS